MMPSKREFQLLLLWLIVVASCYMISLPPLRTSPLSSLSTRIYQAVPTRIDVFELITTPRLFHDETRFPPRIWLECILKDLYDYLKWPRKWYNKVPITSEYYPHRTRSCQISIPNRLLRFSMWMTGTKMKTLKRDFGQSKTTCYRDILFIAHIFNIKFSGRHLYAPSIDSE
eukprot:354703_1